MIISVVSFKGGVGKTTSAVHLAAYFAQMDKTLLVDGDLNRSALQWSEGGQLPFAVVDEKQAIKHAAQYPLIVIDTPARPEPDELKTLAGGCDLMVVPVTPDALAMSATLQMVEGLASLSTPFKLLLTIVPPAPNTTGEDARQAIASAELPLFKNMIRRLAVFQKAALQGVPVYDVKGDSYARIAWRCYESVGKEINV